MCGIVLFGDSCSSCPRLTSCLVLRICAFAARLVPFIIYSLAQEMNVFLLEFLLELLQFPLEVKSSEDKTGEFVLVTCVGEVANLLILIASRGSPVLHT